MFSESTSDRARKRRWPRFTLLHLLILIFLLGLGSGLWFSYTHTELFVPKFLSEKPMGGVAGCARNLTRIGLAMEAFHHDHGDYPQSQRELVPTYLKSLPECPQARRMTYRTCFGPRAGFNPSDNPNYFLVECCGSNHREVWVAPDFPAYDNLSGLILERSW